MTPRDESARLKALDDAPVVPASEMKNDAGVKWFRLKGESKQAFEAFRAYRDIGPTRSLRKTAEAVGKSINMMKRWSARWHWLDRVDAFDAEEAYEVMMRSREARLKMRETDAETARLFKKKVIERLEGLKAKELSPTQLVAMWEAAVKIERLSYGEVTDHTQRTISEKRNDLDEAIAENPDLANELADLLERTRDSQE